MMRSLPTDKGDTHDIVLKSELPSRKLDPEIVETITHSMKQDSFHRPADRGKNQTSDLDQPTISQA
jgi:hypothetical protein